MGCLGGRRWGVSLALEQPPASEKAFGAVGGQKKGEVGGKRRGLGKSYWYTWTEIGK